MRRLTGAMLFGLGLLCVVAAAALAWLIVPTLRQVPYRMTPPPVVVNAPGATFVSVGQQSNGAPEIKVRQGTLRSQTGIRPDFKAAADLTGPLAGKAVIWNVYQKTDWVENQTTVNSAESHIALNRVSGAAMAWPGQCYVDVKNDTGCAKGNIAFSGQLYLFPFGTQKKTYQYFDSTLRRSLPMTYRGTETVAGLPTYRFEQIVPQQDLDVDSATLSGLLGFLAPGAKTGTMNYQASRTLWVEPMTGAIVADREQQHRQLVPAGGRPIDILDATFQYDKATADTIVAQARDGRSQLLLFGRYLPIGLLVAGLVAIVAGVLITRRAGRPGRHTAAAAPEPEPSAVHPG